MGLEISYTLKQTNQSVFKNWRCILKQQIRSEETRKLILASAARLFAENGYEAAGVAAICQRAGVSKGAFYHHFESKQAVLQTLVADWLDGLDSLLQQVLEKEIPVSMILEEMVKMVQEIFLSGQQPVALFLELWMQAARNEEVRQLTTTPFLRYQKVFSTLIQRGIEDGSFQPMDPDLGAQALISWAAGLFLQGILQTDDPWGKNSWQNMQILLNGLNRRT